MNDHHFIFVRSLYTSSLKLLKDQAIGCDYSLDSGLYTQLRLELQKLGFASIYNLKKWDEEGYEIDEEVTLFIRERFKILNENIITSCAGVNVKKGIYGTFKRYFRKRIYFGN